MSAIESLREEPAKYVPAGMFLSLLAWFLVKKALAFFCIEGGCRIMQLIHAVMALCMYIYAWTQNNPHNTPWEDSTFPLEIPLFVSSGFYLMTLTCAKVPENLKNLIAAIALLGVVVIQKGALAAEVYVFMFEFHVFLLWIMDYMKENCTETDVVEIIYAVLYILVRVLLIGWHIYLMASESPIPTEYAVCIVILIAFTLAELPSLYKMLFMKDECPKRTRRRSRSRCCQRRRSRSCRRTRC